MSVVSYMRDHLATQLQQWSRSLRTLRDSDLESERVELRRALEASSGASVAGLLLRMLDDEADRRQASRQGESYS